MQNENGDPSGREQKTTVLLNAPLEMVWEIWTQPEQINHWWGPNGFTSTIEKMEVENGGDWIFTMHSSDGQSFPNRTTFRKVIRHEKLVHEHFDPNFISEIDFESEGDKTLLTWYKLYETQELFDFVEIQYRANEGFKQTIERHQTYLSQMA